MNQWSPLVQWTNPVCTGPVFQCTGAVDWENLCQIFKEVKKMNEYSIIDWFWWLGG